MPPGRKVEPAALTGPEKWLGVPVKMRASIADALSGGTGSLLACATLQPLDVIKTQQQRAWTKRTSMATVVQEQLANGGVRSLWRGLSATLFRTLPGTSLYFTILHRLSRAFPQANNTHLGSLLIAGTGRATMVVTLMPFTVLKTRMEAGREGYHSLRAGLSTMLFKDRFTSMYSGLTATVLRDAPFSALYFMIYSSLKRNVITPDLPQSLPMPVVHFGVGVTAGVIATACTMPQDVIKTRLQLQSSSTTTAAAAVIASGTSNASSSLPGPLRHAKTLQTLLEIWNVQGLRGLFRGFPARALRRSCVAAITWTTYEEVVRGYRKILKVEAV